MSASPPAVEPLLLPPSARSLQPALRRNWMRLPRSARWLLKRVWLLGHNGRLALTVRGEAPRVYFPYTRYDLHPTWGSYLSHPPLRYAPYFTAQLCHYIAPAVPYHLARPSMIEAEHVLALGWQNRDWQWALEHVDLINRVVAQPTCRVLLTLSRGLIDCSKRFLQPDLWPKLEYIYNAFPTQPEMPHPSDRPFTILTIASRFYDKGVPEALRAYEILRGRHRAKVRMILVCQAVPDHWRFPDGVLHYPTPCMSPALKASLYRAADLLLLPCYSETAGCFAEAYAYGVPVVTTRIHHGDEFVREGVTGYLLETPVFCYSAEYGTRWRRWEGFVEECARLSESGAFEPMVEQAVERLEQMLASPADLARMRQEARQFHAEQFSVEVRNRKLLRVYQRALASNS